MQSSAKQKNAGFGSTIRIACAVITNAQGQMLVVRKHGTRAFIQPGGKINSGEDPIDALKRELKEELNCSLVQARFAGHFSARAVNEPKHTVEAAIYLVEIAGDITPAAEITEIRWIDPANPENLPLAPLTFDHVLPLARNFEKQRIEPPGVGD
jgi:8-oxo-dGTP diphosphatase